MFKRFVSSAAKQGTRVVQTKTAVSPKKLSRQEKIALANIRTHSKLQQIDEHFTVFDENVTKVLDLGYVPGNWLEYSKNRLCEIHGLDESAMKDKVYLLGLDILFGTPPLGASTVQGNILSQATHKSISNHFKDYALRQAIKVPSIARDFQNSYYVKEQSDSSIESQLSEIEEKLSGLELEEEGLDYKPQLILSDLSAPFLQDRGFFSNTHTKPYLRFANNPTLNRPILDKPKSSFDLADACLVLCCDLLRKDGTLLLRLQLVQNDDSEYEILATRLERMFGSVRPFSFDQGFESPVTELFFVCKEKKEDFVDKKTIFMP